MYFLLPLNHFCNTPPSVKHGPFVAPYLGRQNVSSMKARSGSIRNCGIAHSALANLETLRNCVLRKQSCGIVYCGPEKHAALPTSDCWWPSPKITWNNCLFKVKRFKLCCPAHLFPNTPRASTTLIQDVDPVALKLTKMKIYKKKFSNFDQY